MHELAICQSLLDQVSEVAQREGAPAVERIELAVGVLSGVEPDLLQRAFTIARAGTVAAQAELHIQTEGARIECPQCGTASEVPAQRLLCPHCGDWQVRLVAGESLTLRRLHLTHVKPADAAGRQA